MSNRHNLIKNKSLKMYHAFSSNYALINLNTWCFNTYLGVYVFILHNFIIFECDFFFDKLNNKKLLLKLSSSKLK